MNFNLAKMLVPLAFCLFLSGCVNTKKRSKEINKRMSFYTLTVDGVECALCAKKAILALETIPNVKKVEFICNDTYYEDCFAKIYLDDCSLAVPADQIKNKLTEVGFELNNLKPGQS